ncbi:MAG TPA: TetR family transcriptional regulator [Trebonia sp.]|nr:TetR family transcriptional regulator [Trebonia sp.]
MMAQAGLRERKKARTRASLREHALRLFREQGYRDTTVEQIAAAAEVSPSTFFRYFPTKEDVVLQDDMDTRVLEAFDRQPPELTPIAAVRAAMREAWNSFTPAEWEQISQGAWLSMEVPEIRARSMNEFARTINAISAALARRTGRRPDDLRVRVVAGAVVGVMMAIFLPESLGDADAPPDAHHVGPAAVERIDEALALLEHGLPL